MEQELKRCSIFFSRMLPCATTAVIGIKDDMSGSVSRISLACGGGVGSSACVQRLVFANGHVVPSTRLSNGLSSLVEPYGYDHPFESASEAHTDW